MHKILWWRQHVGQLLVGIYKPAHMHFGHPFVSRLFVPFSPWFSIVPLRGRTLFLFATVSPFLATADPEAGERAGRYVHFYALIYAHAYTKNNPVSKLKDNKRSPGDVAGTLPLRPKLLPYPEPLHALLLSSPADLIIYCRAQVRLFSRECILFHVLRKNIIINNQEMVDAIFPPGLRNVRGRKMREIPVPW